MKRARTTKVKKTVQKIRTKVQYRSIWKDLVMYNKRPLPLGALKLEDLYNVFSAVRGPDTHDLPGYDRLKVLITGRIRCIAFPEPEKITGIVTFAPLDVIDVMDLRELMIKRGAQAYNRHFIEHLISAMNSTRTNPIWGDSELEAIAQGYLALLATSPVIDEMWGTRRREELDAKLFEYCKSKELNIPAPLIQEVPKPAEPANLQSGL